ncbi:Peptidase [Modestobacter italicus]|uniref:Peptidase n=1 Tax=Modestobacter italicus (strain DSM 44449 / CECT 9708 / BC 501) TaxID=2732864 RepID=I4EX02_MODI5|nr:Peptidase [Modestobacter marinus]
MSPTSSNQAVEQVTARATHLTVTIRCAAVKAFAAEGTGSPDPSTPELRTGVVEPWEDVARVRTPAYFRGGSGLPTVGVLAAHATSGGIMPNSCVHRR